MATIKSFTDLQQSRKLAEILPLESADTIWDLTNPDLPTIRAIPYKDSDYNNKYFNIIACWSLAALLGVIPCGQVNKISDSNKYEASSWNDSGLEIPNYTTVQEFDNPVDACYELILKLNELNLL